MRNLAILTILFILSPILTLYFTNLDRIGIWVWLWIGVWFWFVNSKLDIFTRGLIFVISSVILAIGGRMYLDCKEDEHILEMISQMFLIIGSGIGGNFMAHYFLSQKKN